MQQKLYQINYKNNPTPNGRAGMPNVVNASYIFRGKARAAALKGLYMFVSTHTWFSIQRALMSRMLPDNLLNRWKAYRKGECNRCGLCCKVHFNCSFLASNDDGTFDCTIYNTPHAMSACLTFPINPKDLDEIQRVVAPYGQCAFYFEGAPEPLTFGEVAKLYFKGLREQIAGKPPKQANSGRVN